MKLIPTNRRLAALEATTEGMAKGLTEDPTLEVELTSGKPRYDPQQHKLYVTAMTIEPEKWSDRRLPFAFRGNLNSEAAKCNYTDYTIDPPDWGGHDPEKVKHLARILEEMRVEKIHGAKYKGAAHCFKQKAAYAFDHLGREKATDPDADFGDGRIGEFSALCQAILRVGQGVMPLEAVHPTTQAIMQALASVMEEAWNVDSTSESFEAAIKILDNLEEPPPAEEPPPQEEQTGPPPDDSDEDEDEEEEDDSTGEGEDEPQGSDDEDQDDDSAGKQNEGGDPEEDESGEEEDSPSGGGGQDDRGDGAEEVAAQGEDTGDTTEEDADHEAEVQKVPGSSADGLAAAMRRAAGGAWGKINNDSDIAASKYLGEVHKPYTISKTALDNDEVVQFTLQEKIDAADDAASLVEAAGWAVGRLTSYMTQAILASRESRLVGAQEDGESLDPDALADIALGINGPDVFRRRISQIEESTYVQILVDASGSMGNSAPTYRCTKCEAEAEWTLSGAMTPTCGHPRRAYKAFVEEKAGYAAITAMALHRALNNAFIPHGGMGYTTHNIRNRRSTFGDWTRHTLSTKHYIYVDAPGFHDPGHAIAYLNGEGANIDGESIEFAATYAAKHAGDLDRVILMVISDGLPNGLDYSPSNAANTINSVNRVALAGIEVYAVGVGVGEYFDEFSRLYQGPGPGGAPTGAIHVPSGEGLSDSVLRSLTELVTRGYGSSRRS